MQKIVNFIRNNWLILSILLIASFLRLYRISQYMEFLGDQGRDVVIIREFLKNGNLFFIGPQTSIGNMYLGPWFYYLIAPSLLIANFSPVGPAVFIALLSVATVYLIFKFSLVLFKNPLSAYLAAFFYAISPVVIKYSNFIWNPNVMPFFALLLVFSLYLAFFEKRLNYLVLASFSFIMALNSHYLAFALIPLIALFYLVFIIINRQDKKTLIKLIKPSLFALILFLISLTPQILFDIKHQGQNINALLTFFTQRETTVSIKPYKAIPLAFPLFDQINTRLIFGKNTQISPWGSVAFGLLLSFSFFRILAPTIKQKRVIKLSSKFTGYLLLLSWYAIAIISLGLYKQHVYDHYFAFVFPAVFILLGISLSTIYKYNILGKIIAFFIVISLTYFSFIENPLRFPPVNQLQTTQTITQSIIDSSNNQDFNIALLAKQNYDPGYKYFFYQNNSPIYEIREKLTDQLYVICEPHPDIDCQPINHPEWAIAAFGWAKVETQWEINGIQIYKLVHTQD